MLPNVCVIHSQHLVLSRSGYNIPFHSKEIKFAVTMSDGNKNSVTSTPKGYIAVLETQVAPTMRTSKSFVLVAPN